MTITEAIKKAVERVNLTSEEAETVVEQIMSGECSDAQIAALLTALRMKGETVEEVTGFARVMRRKAAAVRPAISGTLLIDTCGTGGDVSGTFNVSTATAFVVAGAGLRVAKHGNRSISSRCGSADVLESLGVKIDLGPEQIASCIDEAGIGFMFAPRLHDAMKYVAPARRQMGIRTIFNMLGPLTNPAGALNQLIGVYHAELTSIVADVLRRLGSRHVLVVHGGDGMDEITISRESTVTELLAGDIKTYKITPEEVGLERAPVEAIQGGDAEQNARMVLDVLEGEPGPRRDIVLLNSAAALLAGDRSHNIGEGIELAREVIDSGRALRKLEAMIQASNRS
jgi:anthranilate phosphoribosyltransferase